MYYKIGHKLIANFMGINTWETERNNTMVMINGGSGLIEDMLPYHKDFNLIIQVAKKIEELGYHVSFSSRQAQVCNKRWELIIDADFHNSYEENAYDCIVAFIKWYELNSQKN